MRLRYARMDSAIETFEETSRLSDTVRYDFSQMLRPRRATTQTHRVIIRFDYSRRCVCTSYRSVQRVFSRREAAGPTATNSRLLREFIFFFHRTTSSSFSGEAFESKKSHTCQTRDTRFFSLDFFNPVALWTCCARYREMRGEMRALFHPWLERVLFL